MVGNVILKMSNVAVHCKWCSYANVVMFLSRLTANISKMKHLQQVFNDERYQIWLCKKYCSIYWISLSHIVPYIHLSRVRQLQNAWRTIWSQFRLVETRSNYPRGNQLMQYIKIYQQKLIPASLTSVRKPVYWKIKTASVHQQRSRDQNKGFY